MNSVLILLGFTVESLLYENDYLLYDTMHAENTRRVNTLSGQIN